MNTISRRTNPAANILGAAARRALALAALLFCAAGAGANDKPYKQFGDTKVYFSAFNSSFISPEVASRYNIARGADKGLINISVIVDDLPSGKTADVSGVVSNIFAQQQTLQFFEVREGDSVYYLAPFNFQNEDALTFRVRVGIADRPAHAVTFQRTFYRDR
ncbi:MAG: DUF4426 domain-containing protein [Porticoccaceae bacterium]|jgi:hypothetical protein